MTAFEWFRNRTHSDPVMELLLELRIANAKRFPFAYPGLFSRMVETDVAVIDGVLKPIVIATEIPENPGASITNTIEQFAEAIAVESGWNSPEDFYLIEHYPAARYGSNFERSLDQVFFRSAWHGPTWTRIDAAKILELVKHPGDFPV